jgi:hypothetical protein
MSWILGSSKDRGIAVNWIYQFYSIKIPLLVTIAVEKRGKGEKPIKTPIDVSKMDIPVTGI